MMNTATFKALTEFKHDKYTFEAEKTYSAPYDWVAYFVGNGWAESESFKTPDPDSLPQVSEVVLQPDNLVINAGLTNATTGN